MLDLEPQGPLPAQIYWRRRRLAVGLAAGIIVLIVVIVVGIVHTGSSHQHNATSASATTSQSSKNESSNPEEVKTSLTPSFLEGTTLPGGAPIAVVPPPILHDGDDCPDSTLAVKGVTSKPQYFIGEQPQFTMIVTNIGLVSCKRDVGAAVLAAYVYSLDNQRLWSNLDCAPSNETLVKTFKPGDQVTARVTWTGMGSVPQCPLPRPPIGPGTYSLVVQLGNLRSSGVPFILTEPPQPVEAPPPAEETPAP